MEGVGLVPFSFQFFGCLGFVFAEEVGDFGMIEFDSTIQRCLRPVILRINVCTFRDK